MHVVLRSFELKTAGACRWLGIDHVFLTDNESADQAALFAALRDEFPEEWLTLRNEHEKAAQMKVRYRACVRLNMLLAFPRGLHVLVYDGSRFSIQCECATLRDGRGGIGGESWCAASMRVRPIP